MKHLSVAVVILLTFLILLGSSPSLPMAWDEGNVIRRSDRILGWFDQGMPLSTEAIEQGWPYTTQIEGHPAFYGLVVAAGRAVTFDFLDPLTAARFGPICFFAIAVGAVFWRVRKTGVSTGNGPTVRLGPAATNAGTNPAANNWVAAIGAVAAILLLPRLFAHAHFALYDGLLSACWLLAWALFDAGGVRHITCDRKEHESTADDRDDRSWKKSFPKHILFGIALGMTLSCKATGWIAPVPFLVWVFLYPNRKAIICLAIGLPVALLTFFLLNPPLWFDPVDGFLTFLNKNFHRNEMGWNISIQFLGQRYDMDYPLPWYNTLFWVGVTVPASLLILLIVELIAMVRHVFEASLEMLIVLNASVLLVVRMIPGVPVHDGVRLFLPAFGFLGILIGLGAARVWNWKRFPKLAWIGVVILYLAAAFNLFWFAPQWLSYYNILIGGPSGAAAAGMEPTYYWDSLDDDVLDWLNQNTSPGEKVHFSRGSIDNLNFLREWGRLRPDFSYHSPGRYRWRVIQNRPGLLPPEDLRQLREDTPVYEKHLGSGGIGPWRRDVLLLGIYPED